MWGLSALLNPTFFSWSLDPEVRVQGAVCSWVANVWADGGERAEGSRRRKEGGSSLGQGKAAATFWESSFKTAFLFTNFYFGTSDKAAGKFLTPLFPGSARCQLLPLPRAAFLTNPDGFCKQPWLCTLCPEAQAVSCAAQHARLTHQALCSAPPAVLPAFFPCLSMFGGTRLSHQGGRGDKESHVLELPPGQLKGSAKKHGTRGPAQCFQVISEQLFCSFNINFYQPAHGVGSTEAANQHVTQGSDGASGDMTGFCSGRDAAWGCGTCSSLAWGFLTAIPAALHSQQPAPLPGNTTW